MICGGDGAFVSDAPLPPQRKDSGNCFNQSLRYGSLPASFFLWMIFTAHFIVRLMALSMAIIYRGLLYESKHFPAS